MTGLGFQIFGRLVLARSHLKVLECRVYIGFSLGPSLWFGFVLFGFSCVLLEVLSSFFVWILGSGRQRNSSGEKGSAPLLHASGHGHLEIARLLVEAGAEVTDTALEGDSAAQLSVTVSSPARRADV